MASTSAATQRKNVTRACDTCKRRKIRCDGRQPCRRCTQSDIDCTYRSSYNRVQSAFVRGRQGQRSRVSQSSAGLEDTVDFSTFDSRSPKSTPRVLEDTVNYTTQADNEDTGDASVDSFLQRVSGHLAQIGQGLPRRLFMRFEENDHVRKVNNVQTLVLPDKALATSYLEAYFDHGNATCRFLLREHSFALLDKLYTNNEELSQDHASFALILFLIGTGCVWTASWKNEVVAPWRAKALPFFQAAECQLEKVDRIFPPTICVLQAQVLKCQCELVLGRFNSAWMSLGLAVRLGQMIDVQREQPVVTLEPLEAFLRRRIFWAMFMIDRYLAVILGRPTAIQESDITVALSPDLPDTISHQIDACEKKLLIGTALHYQLVKIIGRAATQLYPTRDRAQGSTDIVIMDLELELHSWLQSTPAFFNPLNDDSTRGEEQFYDIPWILKRQQRTVKSAFFFANMLIYRGHLLQDFRCQEPSTPRSNPLSAHVTKCVDNALSMVTLAADFGINECRYNGAFWITSHFVFCAISILLVYLTVCRDLEQRLLVEKAVEDAMAFHRKLDSSVNISAQKLLDESQWRAQIIGSVNPPISSVMGSTYETDMRYQGSPGTTMDKGPEFDGSMQHRATLTLNSEEEVGLEPAQDISQLDSLVSEPFSLSRGFDMIMDIGFDNMRFPDTFAQQSDQHH